ncbi:MAG: 30S ribosomal protein S6 [Alphaproteobacteria bacterium]|nr:30S ribosomal protein S6 [Alphaproteobacteria bacterium]HCQ71377.1 30S ribosomal protein S6 [Rhodospirillaceae bacterium]|tara:strand:- start:1132 stop:1494 length:363 start_codon:yes stop_codon:yes gene_type:complete
MPYYETVFIARQDLSESQVSELTEQMSKVITDNGGKIHKTENWGLRKFAYKMNKASKGHYVLLETDAPSEAITEMERQMRLNEDVVRLQTIREDELSSGPSVIMDKGRDEDNKSHDRKAA